ncbi:unnamed protein product [Dimorphilus gyrociliatus]|uniref:Uncharacterized protein n=1 Tax=Dimorphilus gyrociliatus TaxID=2664684 RepID=A0A7I8VH10_9ANNE|nr:unnamed protein product [Dimorphilus gyrociliatus]
MTSLPNVFRRQRDNEEKLNALFKQHCISFFNFMFGNSTRYSVNAMVIARVQKNEEDRPSGCMLRFEHDNIPAEESLYHSDISSEDGDDLANMSSAKRKCEKSEEDVEEPVTKKAKSDEDLEDEELEDEIEEEEEEEEDDEEEETETNDKEKPSTSSEDANVN